MPLPTDGYQPNRYECEIVSTGGAENVRVRVIVEHGPNQSLEAAVAACDAAADAAADWITTNQPASTLGESRLFSGFLPL